MDLIVASERRLKNQYALAVKQGLEVSSGAKSTSTYYHSKDEQVKAVRKLVGELYNVDKAIPLLLACLDDSTYFFRQEVIRKELSSGYQKGPMGIVNPALWLDNDLQENMVDHILANMSASYVLRLFQSFRETRVNNARTRKKILRWVMGNLTDFMVVKYGNKISSVLKQALGLRVYDGMIYNLKTFVETSVLPDAALTHKTILKYHPSSMEAAKLLLFADGRFVKSDWYDDFKFIKSYFDMKNASTEEKFYEAVKHLDTSVVIGTVVSYRNLLFDQFKNADGTLKDSVKNKILTTSAMTENQKVRTKKLQERTGGARTDVDYSKVQTETLYKTEGVKEQRKVRAERDKITLPYSKIGIIQDRSLSNRGGKDSSNTPEAVIKSLRDTLLASVQDCMVAKSPKNQTDLTKPFVEILEETPDVEAIFVLSDGYENFPYEGCLNDMIKKSRDFGFEGQVIHCSPYVSAEMKAQARSLGEQVITMAVSKPSQITTQMEMRLLDFNPKAYFENQFSKFINVTEHETV